MDPAPPDGKRPRLLSWPTATPQGVTLPLPHQHHPSAAQHPSPLLPPPQAVSAGPPPPPARGSHHPHPVSGSYQPHPSRSTSDPSTAASHSPVDRHQPYREPDCRHDGQDVYAPMQDPYRHQPPPYQHQQHRPAHSPAQPPYHPYPHRDVGVSHDPHEDVQRPSSTGHAPDALPQAPHAHSTSRPPPPHRHSAYAENQSRQMSYDDGNPIAVAHGIYRHPTFPPTPVPPSPYEQHGGFSAPPDSGSSIYSNAALKKKNTRASQACDQCRQLKAKCDETKPCKTCRDKGTECRYRDPIPKATDKAQADILEGIAALQGSMTAMSQQMGRIDHRLTTLEQSARPGSALYIKPDPARGDELHSAPVTPYAVPGGGLGCTEPYRAHVEPASEPASASSDAAPMRIPAEDEIEAEPGPPVPPGEPAIPMNHTTLAGLLLEWPSIRELTKHHLDRQGVRYISEYPVSQEQSRGSLIVYGRGEDSRQSRHTKGAIDHGMLVVYDEPSDVVSPSPAADFGYLGSMSPPEDTEYRGGVLGPDGNPDFSESRVWLYVQAFKGNVLNLHPIIQPDVLDDWVSYFLDTLPPAQSKGQKPGPDPKLCFAVINAQSTNETIGAKRKRSPEPNGAGVPLEKTAKMGKPSRSLHSALVLTVLALGKLCLHRDSIPDVVTIPDSSAHGSPRVRNGAYSSPARGSPPGNSSQSQSSTPVEQERGVHSRRSSFQGTSSMRSGYSLKKNYEVIPGLEYFAFASDILGNHAGNYNNLKNVYANIFAGIYYGQLGRPLESFAFIHKASHNLQFIMRPSLDKMRKMKLNSEFIQEPKYNQLALAFWTCLQLESDLIAELPLPPSGLLSYEDDMPHPNMSLLKGFDQRILDSYPGQLYLRTHLNSIHRMFYAPEDPNKPVQDNFKNVGLVSDAVSGMSWVAPSFAFREDDPPADDILAARLRAKYWGAQVITYRPFIRQILQFSHAIRNNLSSPNLPPRSEFRAGIIAPVIRPGARTSGDINPQVVGLAVKGIKALIESTRAFHGLGDKRLLITNVFGTAHAQWGNLLVLSAAYKDPTLHEYVDEELLKSLFQRTIYFLRQSAASTSSLRIDMNILEGLQRDLFTTSDTRAGSSFSSQTSAPPRTKPAKAAPPSAQSYA